MSKPRQLDLWLYTKVDTLEHSFGTG